MNQPAPDWPAAPAAEAAPPPPPHAPPAPPAAPTPAPAALQFALPATPEAALDVTAPLMPVGPPATPDAPAYPASRAMPQVQEGPATAAMPTFASSMVAEPQHVVVTEVHPAEPAGRAAATTDDASASSVDPSGTWWAPGNALVLAVAGLVAQLVAFYTREQLPVVKASGTQLTNFDRIVGGVPLIDGIIGQALALVLAAGALFMVLYGSRKGLREPPLQLSIGIVAALALLALPLLPIVAG